MTPVRWSPIEELAEMGQDLRFAMQQVPGWPVFTPWAPDGDDCFSPPVDVIERGDDLIFRFDLPGIDPHEDVTVSVDGRKLHVSGQREAKRNEKSETYRLQGMCYGKFDRTFALPEPIDEKAVTAHYRDGILEVKVAGCAKGAATSKGTLIPVTTAQKDAFPESPSSETPAETSVETSAGTGAKPTRKVAVKG